MRQVGFEEQTVARLQQKNLVFDRISKLAFQAEDELPPRVNNRMGAALGMGFEGHQERLGPAADHPRTQVFQHPMSEGDFVSLAGFVKGDLIPGGAGFKEGSDRQLQGKGELLQSRHTGRGFAVLDHAERVDIQLAFFRQGADRQAALIAQVTQSLTDVDQRDRSVDLALLSALRNCAGGLYEVEELLLKMAAYRTCLALHMGTETSHYCSLERLRCQYANYLIVCRDGREGRQDLVLSSESSSCSIT